MWVYGWKGGVDGLMVVGWMDDGLVDGWRWVVGGGWMD